MAHAIFSRYIQNFMGHTLLSNEEQKCNRYQARYQHQKIVVKQKPVFIFRHVEWSTGHKTDDLAEGTARFMT